MVHGEGKASGNRKHIYSEASFKQNVVERSSFETPSHGAATTKDITKHGMSAEEVVNY